MSESTAWMDGARYSNSLYSLNDCSENGIYLTHETDFTENDNNLSVYWSHLFQNKKNKCVKYFEIVCDNSVYVAPYVSYKDKMYSHNIFDDYITLPSKLFVSPDRSKIAFVMCTQLQDINWESCKMSLVDISCYIIDTNTNKCEIINLYSNLKMLVNLNEIYENDEFIDVYWNENSTKIKICWNKNESLIATI